MRKKINSLNFENMNAAWSKADHDFLRFVFRGWVVMTVLGVLLATALVDGSGAQESAHRGSVPEGVTKINPKVYIAPTPKTVCGYEQSLENHGINLDVVVNNKHVVKCEYDQTWSDHSKGSPDFTSAFWVVLTSDIFWAAQMAYALIFAFIVWNECMDSYRKYNSDLRRVVNDRDDLKKRLELLRVKLDAQELKASEQARRIEELRRGITDEKARKAKIAASIICPNCSTNVVTPGDYMCAGCRGEKAA